jgi:hypothetical protein
MFNDLYDLKCIVSGEFAILILLFVNVFYRTLKHLSIFWNASIWICLDTQLKCTVVTRRISVNKVYEYYITSACPFIFQQIYLCQGTYIFLYSNLKFNVWWQSS